MGVDESITALLPIGAAGSSPQYNAGRPRCCCRLRPRRWKLTRRIVVSVSFQDPIFQLAEEQLPTAALYGIGNELATLAAEVARGERLIRLATAYDGHAFGVLALTDERVLWAAGGKPDIEVLAWPRGCVHPASGGACLLVDADDALWKFHSILPVDAAEELVDELSLEGRAGPAVIVLSE